MDKCNLHTVLLLPTGIFHAQVVKTSVLFFTRGKTNLLRREHFANFERAFKADDRRAVVDERFNVFSRLQIADKKNSLDLGLIRDDSPVDFDELPDPIELDRRPSRSRRFTSRRRQQIARVLEGKK